MRKTLLLLALAAPSGAEPVEIRCQPSDSAVYFAAQGESETLLTRGQGPVDVPRAAGKLILKRDGWQTLEIPWPDPRTRLDLQLQAQPGAGMQRALYYGGRFAWLGVLPVGLLAWAGWRRPRVPPATLSGYALGDKIGAGGMAEVFAGQRLSDGRQVAIKRLFPESAQEPADRKRFLREIQICQGLDHPNLIRIYDHGQDDQGRPYFVMELLQGESLRALLAREGSLEWKRAVQLITQAMAGTHAANQAGIAHRDLKPENLQILPDGQVKVLDFGVARGQGFTVATATGLVMGTPEYIAPEQVEGSVAPTCDQYALGVVLYEMLEGHAPFADPDPVTLAFKHVHDTPPRLRKTVPAQLELALMKMLEKKPALRFPHLGAARQRLLEIQAEDEGGSSFAPTDRVEL